MAKFSKQNHLKKNHFLELMDKNPFVNNTGKLNSYIAAIEILNQEKNLIPESPRFYPTMLRLIFYIQL